MITLRTIAVSILLATVPSPVPLLGFSFTDLFNRFPCEEVIDREYHVAPLCTLTVNNHHGNINVQTEWKRNTVCMKAIKRSKKPEQLALFEITDKQNSDDTHSSLSLVTTYYDEQITGRVDYELIVPANITLRLNTNKGSIGVKEVNGPVIANTIEGNIDICNTTNSITACSERSGSITISQARGSVRAITHAGNILVSDARHNVVAHTTKKGNIAVSCVHIPSTGTIQLDTAGGTIELALPQHVNALISGKTDRGTLTSEHPITLKPLATKLDKTAWSRFKKEVDGILGNGEATIKLSNMHGNIKILKATT